MSEHVFVQENLAGYVADGLTAEERERFERHVHGCGDCHRLVEAERAFDDSLGKLFASARPAAGFENRVLTRLRSEPLKRRIAWTKTWRWIGSAAAVLMLGVVGFGMQHVMESGSLPFPGGWATRPQSRNEQEQFALAVQEAANTVQGRISKADDVLGQNKRYTAEDKREAKPDGQPNGSMGKVLEDVQDNGIVKQRLLSAMANKGAGVDPKLLEQAMKAFQGGASNTVAATEAYSAAQQRLEALKQEIRGEEWGRFATSDAALRAYARADGLAKANAKADPAKAAEDLHAKLDDVVKLRAKLGGKEGGDGWAFPPHGYADPVALSRDGKSTDLAMPGAPQGAGKPGGFGDGRGGGGQGGVAGGGFQGGAGYNPFGAGLGGGAGKGPGYAQPGGPPPSATGTTPAPAGIMPGTPPLMGPSPGIPGVDAQILYGNLDANKKADNHLYYKVPVREGPGESPGQSRAEGEPKAPSKDGDFGYRATAPGDSSPKGNEKGGGEYFKESGKGQGEAQEGREKGKGGFRDDKKEAPKGEQSALGKAPKTTAPGDKLIAKSESQKELAAGLKQLLTGQAPQAQPEPKPVVRKIIRTGEIEFEVEGFDSAVAGITQLINGVQGAFIATVNSEKLPNGKVKGSVIVRMPPEHLDKFLLDMRKELAKTGELKGQRIGSQDVTKAYYDLESRLRAARTMEERLIDIIKKGKGEIKDLLLAEKELGVWRTKIEEMEGEIRYYNNQVSLSTLTITLYEKEIRAAAAMVITEHVNMKIEADDVEKALQTALTAVTEAKGRVTKSDLKQHSAGQYEAILQFEVAPANAGPVKDKLRTLGVVTHHDAQRLQQAEGGSGTKGEIKSRVSDVQFSVSLYNVANIKPREAYNFDIATIDVVADYRKLQDAVTQANGQVRSGNLDEKDKLSVTALFEFDVPSSARKTFDTLVNGLGDILTKTTTRAAPGETATDRKVGYRLTLRSLTAVQPRESYKLDIATPDVSADHRTLHDQIAAVKGQVRSTNLNEADKLNTTATLDFDVPAAERGKFDKLLAGLGDTLTRNTIRIPPSQIATARHVGYRLTLRNLATIKPRESYVLQAATPDVSGDYRRLQKAIADAKGQVKTIQLSEQDKLNAFAQIDFDVPAAERGNFDELIAGLGETLSRVTVREAPAETATDLKFGFRLTLRNLAAIQPRESYRLDIATPDVSAEHRKLQETIAAAKGQVRAINLNEQDKLNTTAQLDFDVSSAERAKFDKLLADLGETLSRTTMRVPPGETATDLKTGYRLILRNSAGVQPRESYTLQTVTLDVPGAYQKLKDAVEKAQGHVRTGLLSEPDRLNVSAQLDFDVPKGERDNFDKLLADVGEVYSRNTTRMAPGEVATERKVGYRIRLNNAAAMTPREKVTLGIEVKDVEQTANTFKMMVREKAGAVVADPVTHGVSGVVTATLIFNVPLAAKDDLVRKFRAMGTVRESKSSSNPQAPETKLATVHLDVVLTNVTPIVPADDGITAALRTSLTRSFHVLTFSVMWIFFGLMTVVPWLLLLWVGYKIVKRMIGSKTPAPATTAG